MERQSPYTMDTQGICGAKTKSGRPCQSKPMPNGRCRLHGGKSLAGIASPTFKHGRYSKFLPSRLAGKYIEARDDPQLLELRDDIALLDSRLGEILASLEDGDTRKLWQDLAAAWAGYEQAAIAKDTFRATLALSEIGKLIKRGNTIYASWGEVYGVIDQRRRTVESERKRLVEMQQTITAERAMLLIGALIGVIRQHVTDTATLQAISQDLRAITVIDAGG